MGWHTLLPALPSLGVLRWVEEPASQAWLKPLLPWAPSHASAPCPFQAHWVPPPPWQTCLVHGEDAFLIASGLPLTNQGKKNWHPVYQASKTNLRTGALSAGRTREKLAHFAGVIMSFKKAVVQSIKYAAGTLVPLASASGIGKLRIFFKRSLPHGSAYYVNNLFYIFFLPIDSWNHSMFLSKLLLKED